MPHRWLTVFAIVVFPLAAFAHDSQSPGRPATEAPEMARGAAFEVVFALDTTGSMSGLIEGAKRKIWSIANAIAAADPPPEVRMGLVAYRDRGDAYVTRIEPLTDDLDYFYSSLMQLTAGGGGDTPESVNQALHEAVTAFDWSEDRATLRMIYLVGDAPPHMDYRHDVKYPVSCELAAARDIFINTIQCGGMRQTIPIWQEIANTARGEYLAIAQSGGMVVVSTPFDAEIARHSKNLDGTFVRYGTTTEQAQQVAKIELGKKIDETAGDVANADRAWFKIQSAGKKSFSGGMELAQDIQDGKVKLDEIPVDRLPPELKELPEEKRAQFIEDKLALRQGLREEIEWLYRKRQAYLKEHAAKSADAFDRRVVEVLKRQAATKGIHYAGGEEPEEPPR